MYGEDSARGRDAAVLGNALFPGGAAAITAHAYVIEYAEILTIINRARDEDMAEVVARIPELPAMLAQLEEVHRQDGESLNVHDHGRPTRDHLKTAGARPGVLARIVAAILARHAPTSIPLRGRPFETPARAWRSRRVKDLAHLHE